MWTKKILRVLRKAKCIKKTIFKVQPDEGEGAVINQEEFLKQQMREKQQMKELEALNFLRYSSILR